MKRLLPFLLALSASLTWGQTSHERRYELRPDPNWPLEIELGSGDYQIVASASDSIAVVYDEGNAGACARSRCRSTPDMGRTTSRLPDQNQISMP